MSKLKVAYKKPIIRPRKKSFSKKELLKEKYYCEEDFNNLNKLKTKLKYYIIILFIIMLLSLFI